MRRNVLSPSENRPAWHSANACSNSASTSFGSSIAADIDMGLFHRSELSWGPVALETWPADLTMQPTRFQPWEPENCPVAPGGTATPFDLGQNGATWCPALRY